MRVFDGRNTHFFRQTCRLTGQSIYDKMAKIRSKYFIYHLVRSARSIQLCLTIILLWVMEPWLEGERVNRMSFCFCFWPWLAVAAPPAVQSNHSSSLAPSLPVLPVGVVAASLTRKDPRGHKHKPVSLREEQMLFYMW